MDERATLKELSAIGDDLILLGNWLQERAKRPDVGLPGRSAIGDADQRYDAWLTRWLAQGNAM